MKPANQAAAAAPQKEEKILALDLTPGELDEAMKAYFAKCQEKLGFIPNVLTAYSFDLAKLKAFVAMSDDLMLGKSGISKAEREMIAVVVSSANHCHYCLIAHGAVLRKLTGDIQLADTIVMNYRAAALDARTRAMLDFSWKLTEAPWEVGEEDRAALRKHGFSDRDIWDIAAVAAFFNMSNRLATASGNEPNAEYYAMAR
ncbi:MAG: peroxidase-related enzyme [Xanthobacteraceae bacterium]|nr:peroxidase-related enzyme [Xanthobacteraceae bacterium]QYK44960.1 MAG: peroxidase-related enzyme [Xanthobacteraceae bacterium]